MTGAAGRILVTGADGFTGRYLTPCLQSAGYEVHGLVLDASAADMPDVDQTHHGDVRDAEAVIAIVTRVRPTKVIHLAGIAFVPHEQADAFYTTHVLGARHLLDALVQTGSPVDAVLLASSAAVYGASSDGVVREDRSLAPNTDYGVSKLAMEYMAGLFSARLPIIITRTFNYTGVGQHPSFVIPKIVDHFRRDEETIALGNLSIVRDFSDVRDVVAIYCRLIETSGAVGETVNVCSGRAFTLRSILDLVSELSGRSIQVRFDAALVRDQDVTWSQGSRDKLEALIGPAKVSAWPDTLRWMLEA